MNDATLCFHPVGMRGCHAVVNGVRQPIFVESGRSDRDRPRGDLRHNRRLQFTSMPLWTPICSISTASKFEFVSIRGSGVALAALAADEIQYLYCAEDATIPGMASGSDAKLIASPLVGLSWVMLARKDIKSPEELKGKSIAAVASKLGNLGLVADYAAPTSSSPKSAKNTDRWSKSQRKPGWSSKRPAALQGGRP